MANNEYGTTWWGRRWLNALSGIDYENRIPRGKDYADAGKVRSLRIDEEKGEVKARVRDTTIPSTASRLRFRRSTSRTWHVLLTVSPNLLSSWRASPREN